MSVNFPAFLCGVTPEETIGTKLRKDLDYLSRRYFRAGGVITPEVWANLSPDVHEVLERARCKVEAERAEMAVDALMKALQGVIESASARKLVSRGLEEALKP